MPGYCQCKREALTPVHVSYNPAYYHCYLRICLYCRQGQSSVNRLRHIHKSGEVVFQNVMYHIRKSIHCFQFFVFIPQCRIGILNRVIIFFICRYCMALSYTQLNMRNIICFAYDIERCTSVFIYLTWRYLIMEIDIVSQNKDLFDKVTSIF